AGFGEDVETVFELDLKFGGFGVGDAVHGAVEVVSFEGEFDVVEVGEHHALIEILGSALDEVRGRAPAAGDEVGDVFDNITLVVVNVPGRDEELSVRLPGCL